MPHKATHTYLRTSKTTELPSPLFLKTKSEWKKQTFFLCSHTTIKTETSLTKRVEFFSPRPSKQSILQQIPARCPPVSHAIP